jgi:hypothetical protein
MIKDNVMDVFSVAFANGDKFCLMARDITMARLTAHELVPDHAIVAVHKVDQWYDSND